MSNEVTVTPQGLNEAYILQSSYLREGKVVEDYNKDYLKAFVQSIADLLSKPTTNEVVLKEDEEELRKMMEREARAKDKEKK